MKTYPSYATAILRIGLAAVFLWFGLSQMLMPEDWISYLPGFMLEMPISPRTIIIANAAVEIVFGILLGIGFLTRISALILGTHLLGIAVSLGYNAIAVRDIGLALATLSIALGGAGTISVDEKLGAKADKRAWSIGVVSIIALIVVSHTLGSGSRLLNADNALPDNAQDSQRTESGSIGGQTNSQKTLVTLNEQEVAKHKGQSSCWTIIGDKVYDVTGFIFVHPGGPQRILGLCGVDGTSAFRGRHGTGGRANSALSTYYIGDLGAGANISASPPSSNTTGDSPTRWRGFDDDDDD